MGDNGCLYVPKTLIPIYQDEIIPLCDICTPNQFEAEILTGKTIKTSSDAWKAMEWFHNKGVKTVVLSSTNTKDSNGELKAFLSHKGVSEQLKYTVTIPVIGDGIVFTGAGDLFAALFLAHSASKATLREAFELTIATLQSVLKNTLKSIPERDRNAERVQPQQRELKLIQSKFDIENPKVQLKVEEIN